MLTRAFDRTGTMRRPPLTALLGEAWSLAAYRPTKPDPRSLPNGQGQSVLVIPAFLSGDYSTNDLRRFLDQCGFRTYAWRAGINWGPTPHILAKLHRRLVEIERETGQPVSLIGISLGGLLARGLAHKLPHIVRHVVTVACPINLPTATALEPVFHALTPFYSPVLDIERLCASPPVPWTAIYSRDDGLVAWESCASAEESGGLCVSVRARHTTMCRNPKALKLMVERLVPR